MRNPLLLETTEVLALDEPCLSLAFRAARAIWYTSAAVRQLEGSTTPLRLAITTGAAAVSDRLIVFIDWKH